MRFPKGLMALSFLALIWTGCASTGSQATPGAAPPAQDAENAQPAAEADDAAGEAQAEEGEDQAQNDPNPHITGDMSASARVANIEFSPSPVEITRGDTILLQGTLTDDAGNQIRGARWGIGVDPRVAGVQSIKDSIPDSYLLWGVAPGDITVNVVLPRQGEDGFDWQQITTFDVHVEDWPVARVEVDAPAYGTYAGSVFPLAGRVITTHDTEHATATLEWRSDDPEIVSITGDGVATFHTPGSTRVVASSEGAEQALAISVRPNPVRTVDLQADLTAVRTGDVVHVEPSVLDAGGESVDDIHIAFSVAAVGSGADGEVFDDGTFVANTPGAYSVIATAGGQSASVVVDARPREAARSSQLVGRGPVAHVTTSDLWVFEGRDGRDYTYTGTHAQGGGERMYVWDVTDPSSPVITDSIVADARVVNDVKVNADASWAVITREGASSRRNGIIVLDIADPAHPTVLAELTDSLTAGIHNVWINEDVVYAVNGGTSAMHIIDMVDPSNPTHIGRWEVRPGEQDKSLHDIWAEDGLAYLSYWDDGLIILDVGAGIKGGTAREPKFVSQYKYTTQQPETYGNTHTAFRYGDYVFLGDEIFGCGDCVNGPRGYIHVVDVRDIENPKEVARYEVPEAGAHNIWVADDRLYVAYYQGGLRVVDVSGELRGDLYKQGREVAWYHSAGSEGEAIVPNAPLAWGPQPHKGRLFVSDMNSGLWVIEVEPQEPLVP